MPTPPTQIAAPIVNQPPHTQEELQAFRYAKVLRFQAEDYHRRMTPEQQEQYKKLSPQAQFNLTAQRLGAYERQHIAQQQALARQKQMAQQQQPLAIQKRMALQNHMAQQQQMMQQKSMFDPRQMAQQQVPQQLQQRQGHLQQQVSQLQQSPRLQQGPQIQRGPQLQRGAQLQQGLQAQQSPQVQQTPQQQQQASQHVQQHDQFNAFARNFVKTLSLELRQQFQQLPPQVQKKRVLNLYWGMKQTHANQSQQEQQQQHMRAIQQQQQAGQVQQQKEAAQEEPQPQLQQQVRQPPQQSTSQQLGQPMQLMQQPKFTPHQKRSLPDDDDDGRATKVAKVSAPVAKKQSKSQDATLPKKARGRPRQIPEVKADSAPKASPPSPVLPSPAPHHTEVDAQEVVDLTQLEQSAPPSEPSLLPLGNISTPAAKVVIRQSAAGPLYVQAQSTGVRMADVEYGTTIHESMKGYSAQHMVRSQIAPAFTANTTTTSAETQGSGYSDENVRSALQKYLAGSRDTLVPSDSICQEQMTEESANLYWQMQNTPEYRENDHAFKPGMYGFDTLY
jgi:hypothetical protein